MNGGGFAPQPGTGFDIPTEEVVFSATMSRQIQFVPCCCTNGSFRPEGAARAM
jgi:hypothetical protein